MKRNYEIYGKLIFVFWMFILGIILVCIVLVNNKIVLYKMFDGFVYEDDLLVFVLTDDELLFFNRNKKFFIENKDRKFKIYKIEKAVLNKGGEVYNRVFIKTDISNMYKVGDVVRISIMEKNVRSYKIFKIIWEGE